MKFTLADVAAYEAKRKWKAPVQPTAPSKQSEAQIQEAIAAYLRGFGRDCQFVRSRMDKPTTYQLGTPDFVGVLRGVPFALEVKRPGCKETREQAGQIMAWQLAGARVAVVHSLEEAQGFVAGKVLLV